ncbi:MAG: HSP20 family protein [Saprospiraceae bacterium]|jgi:HSP20 family protein
MNHPDIKSYFRDKRQHFIDPHIHGTHFLGRNAMDVRWRMKNPATNFRQEGFLFELKIAMPGFIKKDIQIHINNNILTVKGKKKKLEETPSEYILREFDVEVLERKFKLGKGIAYEKINAEYTNGILKITFIDLEGNKELSHREIEVL